MVVFWARESQDNNKGGVGDVLEVVVCGGARRWWPDEGWPAVREKRGNEMKW